MTFRAIAILALIALLAPLSTAHAKETDTPRLKLSASDDGGVTTVKVGQERYEIPKEVFFGG